MLEAAFDGGLIFDMRFAMPGEGLSAVGGREALNQNLLPEVPTVALYFD